MRKFKFLLPVFAVVLGASACHRFANSEKRADMVASRIASQLDLTDEQTVKLNDLKESIKVVMKNRDDRAAMKDELKALILAPKLEGDAVKGLIEKKRSAMQSKIDGAYDSVFPKLAAFHESLTPEQKQKAADTLDKFSKRFAQ